MNHIHVCLISDHPIPNILGIHHFRPDNMLFITTERMEEKGKADSILKALDILNCNCKKESMNRIVVDEDSILDCNNKLEKWVQGKENYNFVVNLTCGTKIMSIAAYDFFKDYSSKMIYIPIGKNEFITPFPKKKPHEPEKLKLRFCVIEYLTSYRLDITNSKRLQGYRKDAIQRKEISDWIMDNYDMVKNLLIWLSGNLRHHRDERKIDFANTFSGPTDEERELLVKLGFECKNGLVSKSLERSEIGYLTGGWLEEFCFNKLLKYEGKGIDDVVIGLKLMNEQRRDNEFDVMFTKDNALYFVECKSLDQHDDKKAEVLYKIGALQKDFGLRVKSYLVTTSPYILKNGRLRESVRARAEQFNTEVVHPAEVVNFEDKIVKSLKLGGFK